MDIAIYAHLSSEDEDKLYNNENSENIEKRMNN